MGELIRVPPEWWDIRLSGWQPPKTESERSHPNTLAGKDKDGSALNIASAVFDGLQVIGHSKYKRGLEFCSPQGAESMGVARSGPHAILANLEEYEWRTVTVKDLNACAAERGVDLTYFTDRKGDRLYACRIDFHGWVNSESCGFGSQNKMVKGDDRKDSKCLLPGIYRAGSRSPEFCYDGRFNRSLDGDTIVELLCYKELQREMKSSYRCINYIPQSESKGLCI